MKRMERVFDTAMKLLIEKEAGGDTSGITALEVAEALDIQRCDSSSDLNKLCQEGKLRKSNTRPVRFFAATSDDTEYGAAESGVAVSGTAVSNTAFSNAADSANGAPAHNSEALFDTARADRPMDSLDKLEQDNPSLSHAILLARAAVSYPPHGLNILLTGETGVGKNFLAESIWKYAAERSLFGAGKKIPFVTFSCAEYADNPQLLLSQLFGYKKGAFTGASEDKSGLIEEADGGIFFLDEVHRLPPTGQEMLFSLIDKGTIRRLGDKTDRTVKVMLICATTEDLNTALLKTFLRRIPVSIHIPSLSQRSAPEKLHFIRFFLQQAVKETGMSFHVNPQALQSLLRYSPEGNIGDFKNTMNLCCARAYLNYYLDQDKTSPDIGTLEITLLELPQKVYNQDAPNPVDFHMLSPTLLEKGLLVSASGDTEQHTTAALNETPDLYGFIERRTKNYTQLHIDHEELTKRISTDVDSYFMNLSQRLNSNEIDTPDGLRRVPEKFRDLAISILSKAEKQFHCVYSSNLLWGFSLHLWQFSRRYANNEIIYNPNLQTIKHRHYQELYFLSSLQPELIKFFGHTIPEDELGFWVMFLTQRKDENYAKSKVRLLLAAESGATAENIATRINKDMMQKCVYTLELPPTADPHSNYKLLADWLRNDKQTEYLILTDNDAAARWEELLYLEIGTSCRIIPFLSYSLALTAAKEIIANADTVEHLFQFVTDSLFQKVRSFYELRCKEEDFVFSRELPEIGDSSKIIVTLCSSGRGSASMLKEMLDSSLQDVEDLSIVAMGLQDDLASFKEQTGDRLKLIVSGVKSPIPGIPQVGVNSVFTPGGIEEIRTYLENNVPLPSEADAFNLKELEDLLSGCCSSLAPSLPSDAVLKAGLSFCQKIYSQQLTTHTTNNFFVGLSMHYICMLDRIRTGGVYEVPEWGNSIIRRNHSLYLRLKEILKETCSPLSLEVPAGEVCYLLQVL